MHTLSIVIPALNEERRLPATLEAIRAYGASPQAAFRLQEVIVVDDGSQDATSGVAASWSGRLPMRVIRLPQNRGKGAASRAGMLAASGDWLLLYDADAATPVEEVALLMDACTKGATVAIGSRLGSRRSPVHMSSHRRLIGRVYHALIAALVPGIRDTACGCKLFQRDVGHRLFRMQVINRFAFDVEVLSLALEQGETVAEVPVRWESVPESKVRLVNDSIEMFLCICRLYVRRIRRNHGWERRDTVAQEEAVRG